MGIKIIGNYIILTEKITFTNVKLNMGVWRDAVLQVKDEFESCSAILLFKYDRKIYIY